MLLGGRVEGCQSRKHMGRYFLKTLETSLFSVFIYPYTCLVLFPRLHWL